MKVTLVILASLSAVAFAHSPSHVQNSFLVVSRANLNGSKTHEHKEHDVSDFRLPCNCPAAVCDPRMNAKSICQCKAAALQACYIKTAGGCKMPAKKACK